MHGLTKLAVTGTIVAAAACVLSGAAFAGINVRLTTLNPNPAPGDTFVVQAQVTVADSAFNAFHLVVHFDPNLVTFLPAAPVSAQIGTVMSSGCGTLFHIFNAFADSTVADLSLLCANTSVTGPGEIYRLKFVASGGAGVAAFTVGSSSRFYEAGTVVVGHVAGAPRVPASSGWLLEAPRPNPQHSGQGANVAFALAAPARVTLDLIDLAGRRVASRDLGDMAAGRADVRWAVPGLAAGRYELRLLADGRVVARRAWIVLR